jgi:hypothetical protein
LFDEKPEGQKSHDTGPFIKKNTWGFFSKQKLPLGRQSKTSLGTCLKKTKTRRE